MITGGYPHGNSEPPPWFQRENVENALPFEASWVLEASKIHENVANSAKPTKLATNDLKMFMNSVDLHYMYSIIRIEKTLH